MRCMLSYAIRGSGPQATVLLHGFLGSGRNLGALARRLLEGSPQTRLILPDLTGHGASPPLPPNAGLDVLTGGLQEVLDTLLAAPTQAPSREAMRDIFLEAGVAGALADWVTMNLVVDPQGVRWRIDRAALGAFNARQFGTNLWDVVQVLGPRCLCVRGGRSAFVSDHTYAKFAALGARVHTLPDAGHFVHVDSQAALIDILTQS
jgi:esterase